MLCSRCSEPVAPVVALDIDGTLAPYHPHFITFVNSWTGYELPAGWVYTGRERFRDWVCDAYGIDLTTFREIKLAYRQGGLKRSMGVYAGAAGLAGGLRGAGAEVWLTTTRPHDRYDRIDPDTLEWARRNEIPFDGLLFGEDKMGELVARVEPGRIVAVLDDLPENLERAAELGIGWPVLRRTEHNGDLFWPGDEVEYLGVARDRLTRAVQRWREIHV